jgi:hypothetical protein
LCILNIRSSSFVLSGLIYQRHMTVS